MTPQNIIDEARYIVNDNNSTIGYRQSDAEMLVYVHGGLRECGILNPELYSTVSSHVCTTSKCEQTLSFTNTLGLIEVLCIQNGTGLTRFDVNAMNLYNPGWRSDAVGAARQWSPNGGDPLRFFIYPAAPATPQTLDVRHSAIPGTYAIDATITDLPDSYRSALVDYVVYRAQSKDDENVVSPRAKMFYDSFVSKVKRG